MLNIYRIDNQSIPIPLPLLMEHISAGFPSPADDYLEKIIDLNTEVIKNPSSTFLGKVGGVSMIEAGFYPGDIVIIDKSLQLENNDIAVCYVDGNFTMKRVNIDKTGVWLKPENSSYKPILVTEQNEFLVWGIVTYIFKKIRKEKIYGNVRKREQTVCFD